MGMVLAITWAFVMDYLDHTVRSAKDVQQYFNTRVLGSLPKI